MNTVRPQRREPAQPPSSTLAGKQVPELVFGHSAVMQDVKRKLQSAVTTDLAVLLHGECGTGKNLCARYIHQASTRSAHALVKVNCPAIPASLLDTELFGYNKGAFAGAKQTKEGRVEQAHRGTLVLDEVGSLDSFAQTKLLQVLQDGIFSRAGGLEMHNISTRLVSIARSDLRHKVQEGAFRTDLLYRLNSISICLPPLRERLEDLPYLIDTFTARHTLAFGTQRPPLTKRILQLMREYRWPGNLRELDNLIRNYILLGDERAIGTEVELASEDRGQEPHTEIDIKKPFSLRRITKKATQELERQIIMKVLQANGWNRQRTAKWLQISYRSLLYKLSEVENVRDHVNNPHLGSIFESSSRQPLPATAEVRPLQVQ